MTLSGLAPIRLPEQVGQLRSAAAAGTGGFSEVMASAVETVNSLQNSADATVRRFLSGEGGELHQVALEQQQAQLSFDLFLQMRNKAVQAYQEVMRMQL
ncbi:MAG: flagellar hook-basal body complex protein FliE [Acidobacteria bacterium]|nr:flagellar hook-basal body complex protein FliE [Acidobacteriota bacterium]